MISWPRRASARGSAAETSARPPVFMNGVISDVTNAIRNGAALTRGRPDADAPAMRATAEIELVRIDRLGEVDLVPGGQGPAAIVGAGVGGEGDRGHEASLLRGQGAHAREQRVAVFAGHADVAHQHVRAVAAQGGAGPPPRRRPASTSAPEWPRAAASRSRVSASSSTTSTRTPASRAGTRRSRALGRAWAPRPPSRQPEPDGEDRALRRAPSLCASTLPPCSSTRWLPARAPGPGRRGRAWCELSAWRKRSNT